MKKEFNNHIDNDILKEIEMFIKKGYILEMVLNESLELPGIQINPQKKILIAGVKKLSLVFSNKNTYKIFPIECNFPHNDLDFNYEYLSDIFNIKLLPFYEITVFDFHKLKKTNLFHINAGLSINEIKVMSLIDEYSYKPNSKSIELKIDVDLGLVLYATNGYVISICMEDFSFLNLNIYYSNHFFDDEIRHISSSLFNNKIGVKKY